MPIGSSDIFSQMEKLLNAKIAKIEARAFQRGAEAAASVADDYNRSTIHDYRLGDCILGKMNIRKTKIRKNKLRIIRYGENKQTLCQDGYSY